MQTYIPIGNAILVKKLDDGTKIEAGILIPDQARTGMAALQTGVVLAVGPGVYSERGIRCPPQPVIGDKVIFGKMAGLDLTVDNVYEPVNADAPKKIKAKLLQEQHIYAILTGEAEPEESFLLKK